MDMTADKIEAIRSEMGSRLRILVHHYQRSSVVAHGDDIGDSLELARKAAASDAERIIFCGVKFMAESADILTSPDQKVYQPAVTAGCPMADMATAAQGEKAWQELTDIVKGWTPIVYVNSSAAVKSVCGTHEGSTCTSSNAGLVFKWALARTGRILFFPDEHLGVNTAHDLGIPDSEIAVYDPREPMGGLSLQQIQDSKVVVWKGFCIVHQAFSEHVIHQLRAQNPTAKIIVHPEAPSALVQLCDMHGSTAQLINYVEAAPDGTTIYVGTELNLVQRLAEKHADRLTVKALANSVCANMAKTTEQNLLDVLQRWPEINRVSVANCDKRNAHRALETMLSL